MLAPLPWRLDARTQRARSADSHRAPASKAYLAFRVPSGKRAIVDDFVASDPYVQNGIVTHHAVREWSVLVGSAHEVADE